MKIGLLDVDNMPSFPNLPLMKISTYHKNKGDDVEVYNPFSEYDKVYQAKVFSEEFTPDYNYFIKADEIEKGGTGYDLKNKLPFEIEHQYPDYDLFGEKIKGRAFGFLTRGCPRGCGFCIVKDKEGINTVQVAELSEFWRGQKYIELLDPNITACKTKEKLFQDLIKTGSWIDFNQGLDIRLTTEDDIKLFKKMKIKRFHFAWDYPDRDLTPHFERFNKHSNYHRSKKAVYVLTNYNSTHEQDLYRVDWLKAHDFEPYVMIYDKWKSPKITLNLQRYVNNRKIFRSCNSFSDYMKQGVPNDNQITLFDNI